MFALFLYQIERWWRELHERLERCFKFLQDQGHYNTNSETDRYYLYLNSFESHTISSVYANALPKSNKHSCLITSVQYFLDGRVVIYKELLRSKLMKNQICFVNKVRLSQH